MSVVTDKCYQAKPAELTREWFCVDAEGQVLGRLATKLATVLMGKHKPIYTPHVECGDYVVVTNAEKVKLTGRKRESMTYDRYTYYPGGRKQISLAEMQRKHPGRVIEHAVRRMLPKSAQGRRILRNLKVFAGSEHPHQAQQCKPLELEKI